MSGERERVDQITAEDLDRINALLNQVGRGNVHWGAEDALSVWVAEAHMESARRAGNRLLVATWALVGATVALVLATVGLMITSG